MQTSRTGQRLRNSEDGYTLLELLIVMAILAMMAGMTLTRLPGIRDGPRFEAAVRDIGNMLRLARSTALADGRAVAFWIDVDRKQYGIEGGPQKAVALDQAVLTVYSASEERMRANEARILFFPDGSATGGVIEIATGSRHASLNIDWLTGNVDPRP
jgi:general secretion pathway protein H